MSKRSVKVITANGTYFYTTSQLAKAMLKAGTAKVASQNPFVLRSTGVLTIFNTLVPEGCKKFKQFFKRQYIYAKTSKLLRAENKDYIECQRQKFQRLKEGNQQS